MRKSVAVSVSQYVGAKAAGFNNPTHPSALAVACILVLFWSTLFLLTVKAIKRDPKLRSKLILVGLASLLVVAAPVLLYVIVTVFVLIDVK